MTALVPHTAMVFAAGMGSRMRPVTDAIPKPLVAVGGRAMLDHMLDRLHDAGVSRAIVNVHYRADQIERHLADRAAPAITISDERDKLLDQGGGIRKALGSLGRNAFLVCNTDALWIEGPRPNLPRLFADWNPETMDVLLLVASSVTSVGVDWPGDFTMASDGRLSRRSEGGVAPFVYAGVGVMKPELFHDIDEDVFRLAPFFFRAAEQGRLFGTRLDGTGFTSARPAPSPKRRRALERSAL